MRRTKRPGTAPHPLPFAARHDTSPYSAQTTPAGASGNTRLTAEKGAAPIEGVEKIPLIAASRQQQMPPVCREPRVLRVGRRASARDRLSAFADSASAHFKRAPAAAHPAHIVMSELKPLSNMVRPFRCSHGLASNREQAGNPCRPKQPT